MLDPACRWADKNVGQKETRAADFRVSIPKKGYANDHEAKPSMCQFIIWKEWFNYSFMKHNIEICCKLEELI